MKFGINQLPKILVATIFILHLNAYSQDEQSVFEEVIVTAEKRDESLQDVSQAGQVELMLKVCNRFLSQNGIALLSLKAASERWNDGGDEGRFSDAESKISDSQMKLVERIDLKGLEDQHVMYVLRPH